METTKLDQAEVKRVTDASRTATVTMILLGFRERARQETNLANVKAQLLEMKEEIVDKDYMDFWRGLEAAGAGSIILGRRGKQTRFEWNYSLREVAKVAIEGHDEEIKLLALKRKPKAIVVTQSRKELPGTEVVKCKRVNRQELIIFQVPVKGRTVEVAIPANLSKDEFERVKNSLEYPVS